MCSNSCDHIEHSHLHVQSLENDFQLFLCPLTWDNGHVHSLVNYVLFVAYFSLCGGKSTLVGLNISVHCSISDSAVISINVSVSLRFMSTRRLVHIFTLTPRLFIFSLFRHECTSKVITFSRGSRDSVSNSPVSHRYIEPSDKVCGTSKSLTDGTNP